MATTGWKSWLFTIDHKKIGIMYGATALFFFLVGGIEALLIRLQLAQPDGKLLSADTYNQMFTMHATTMVFLVIMPMAAAFGNYLVPLQIGARDVAFPRLNSFGFWAFFFGGVFLNLSWFMGGAPDGGWFAYAPNTGVPFSPTHGMDFWVLALQITGLASLTGAINLIVTILNMRAPGMSLMRMPIFTLDDPGRAVPAGVRHPGHHRGAGAPELPAPVRGHVLQRGRRGRPAAVAAPVLDLRAPGGLHPHACPASASCPKCCPSSAASRCSATRSWCSPARPSASWAGASGPTTCSPRAWVPCRWPCSPLSTMFIAVPTGVKIINWMLTMWGGRLGFTTAMLFAIGLIVEFTIGGLSGVTHAISPSDTQQTDTYYIVAHFHYVLFGGAIFGIFAGFYYWWPKIFGRMLSEKLGKWNFWLMVIGMNLTFGPMHIVGLEGQSRRNYRVIPGMGVSASGTWSRPSARSSSPWGCCSSSSTPCAPTCARAPPRSTRGTPAPWSG